MTLLTVSDQCLSRVHLRVLGSLGRELISARNDHLSWNGNLLRQDVLNGDRIRNLPLVHDLPVLEVHPVHRVLAIGVHNKHVGILVMKHYLQCPVLFSYLWGWSSAYSTDLLGSERFPLQIRDLVDRRGKFELVVVGVLEDSNHISSDYERSIVLVSNGQLLVLPSTAL